MTDVFLDESFVGTINNKDEFIGKLKEQRRNKEFLRTMNIYYDEEFDELYLNACNGRARRPLILVKDGIIEYLDAGEEENSLIALNENELTSEHTHLEIAPITILGITTSLVP